MVFSLILTLKIRFGVKNLKISPQSFNNQNFLSINVTTTWSRQTETKFHPIQDGYQTRENNKFVL